MSQKPAFLECIKQKDKNFIIYSEPYKTEVLMLREKYKTTIALSLVSAMLTALLIAGCSSETETRETESNTALQQTPLPIEAITPAYEYADTAKSLLYISANFAQCTSSCTSSSDVVQISVKQTLQQFLGLWIWNDVDDASWSATKNGSSISVVNSKSGLPSGTYRLESVFTLTASSGKTETITIYSEETLTQAPVSEAEPNEAESENPERIPEEKLAEWDFEKLIAETTSPEWDVDTEQKNRFLDSLGDEELKTAYQKAYALFMISYRDCDDLINRALLTEYYGEDFYSDAPKVEMADGRSMHPSGYLYESYENAFYDTFTSDRADAFLVRFGNIAAQDGKELVYEEASNTRHCSPEYEILSRTEDEIVIRETCYGEDLEGNRLDTILYINDNRFVKENGKWKCAEFDTQNADF